MEYIFDQKQLENLIKNFVQIQFSDDKNFKIVKEVKFVEVEESNGFIEYRIFLELVDEIQEYLTKYKVWSNFLKQYDGYALYGIEVERAIKNHNKNLSPYLRNINVYQIFRDIEDFLYKSLGLKLHPSLCRTYFFMPK
jgi:hypothetical protein